MCFLIIKMDDFRGDLSAISATTATLVMQECTPNHYSALRFWTLFCSLSGVAVACTVAFRMIRQLWNPSSGESRLVSNHQHILEDAVNPLVMYLSTRLSHKMCQILMSLGGIAVASCMTLLFYHVSRVDT